MQFGKASGLGRIHCYWTSSAGKATLVKHKSYSRRKILLKSRRSWTAVA